MSYLTETATLEYETSGSNGNYEYHLPHTKTIDLIGEEFAPKRSQNQQQPSVIVETIDSADTNGSSIVTPITTMSSQHLGPNVVYVNSTGGSGVPLQIQQIIQQAQQQVKFDEYWDFHVSLHVGTQYGPSGLNPRSSEQTNLFCQTFVTSTRKTNQISCV